ncbi:hypothetical protein SAMN04487996_12269 [Dyadobacter soli]|uniref:Uncharacterized protein n=1 Tax=Dyadobacter soli TaxID=659014 RepID=A0A1G7WJC4_9BACT|nr:hypothetical protein [Dyadobacter soli]SDG72065.1 hypothetical protein SAMN04487996_12269 [Dyadobacter soli]
MQEIVINGSTHKFPQDWQEVSRHKLPALLKNLFVLPESGETYHELLRITLGYTSKQWGRIMDRLFGKKSPEANKDQSALVLAELLRQLSWMWQTDLTVAPFSSFEVDGQRWEVFTEGFRSMSFGELSDAYIHAQAFIKQLVEGEERLDMLVATLCRPKRKRKYQNDPDWNGDEREDYNEHIAANRAKLLTGRFFDEKVLVLVYFLGTVKNFFSYFDLFENDGSKPPVPEDFPGQSLIKNQYELSQKQIFGSMSQTKRANVHEVFQFLEEHRKDVKAEIERNKSKN